MDLRPNDHVVLLLTAHLPGVPSQPLAPGEWSRFSNWLGEHDHAPADLLVGDPLRTIQGWSDKTVTEERIVTLLERSFQLGMLMDKWQRAGLWVITRASADYPKLLHERLGDQSPPIFYGAGDRKKLDTKALAVVGSRNAAEEDLQFARDLGHRAAQEGWSIVSGGARGVDEASMRGAIEASGTVIGVVADSLLKSATSHKYRDAIQRSDIVLLCPFHPESGFSGPNAMARNKHVYCLSRAAVVVCSDTGKGGTWAGATEDLKKKWVPVWVKHHPDPRSGNRALIERGAQALPDADPHALRMEDLASGSLRKAELFEAGSVVHESTTPYRPERQPASGLNGHTDPVASEADDMAAICKALTTPMSSKALEKHMAWNPTRVERTLNLLVHLNKVQPLKRKGGKYALVEADLFS